MTDAQTEARAIAHKLQDVVDGTDGWLNIDKATDIIAYTLAALNDECQQSMREIARERDRAERAEHMLELSRATTEAVLARAERAEAQLAEIKEGSKQHFAANMSPMRAYWLQTDHTRLMIENERQRAQLAEARKALEIADAFLRCIRFDRDRDTFAAEAVDAIRAARRVLEGGGDV